MADTPWTEKMIASLKSMWTDGRLSASVIAKKLGLRSRSAVLGKLSRLGLMKTRPKAVTTANNHVARPRARKAPAGRQAPWAKPVSKPILVELDADGARIPRHLSIMEINHTTCKFPYGDSNFTYCGHRVADGSVYCMEHHLMSYTPVPVRVR